MGAAAETAEGWPSLAAIANLGMRIVTEELIDGGSGIRGQGLLLQRHLPAGVERRGFGESTLATLL